MAGNPKPDGSLNERFPGSVEAQATRLREEEYIIELSKSKKAPRIEEFEKSLQTLGL